MNSSQLLNIQNIASALFPPPCGRTPCRARRLLGRLLGSPFSSSFFLSPLCPHFGWSIGYRILPADIQRLRPQRNQILRANFSQRVHSPWAPFGRPISSALTPTVVIPASSCSSITPSARRSTMARPQARMELFSQLTACSILIT